MSAYRVKFCVENGDVVECLVYAYNRYRALAAAMLHTAIKQFKSVDIKPA